MGEQAAALQASSHPTERPAAPSGLAVQLHQPGKKSEWQQSPGVLFVLAGVSNMCGAAATNPINVVKVRMQLDGALAKQGVAHERVYPGFFKGIMRIGKEEGVQGLWRGTGAALLREASYSSIRMGAYEPFKKAFGADNPAHTPLWIKVAAGASAGTIGSAIANPTDVIMIRMQAPALSTSIAGVSGSWQYRGPFHAFGSIARTEGLRGLFRGVGPTMQRAALLNAAQVPTYDHTKHYLLNSGLMKEGTGSHLAASMAAGLATALAIAPVDLMRTRIMQQAVHPHGDGVLYSSTLDCFWKTLRAEGPQGLYKGFVPVWLRIGPHTIITLFCFEEFRSMLGIRPI
ncbi:hypothetical protein MPTK1_5g15390 [Marchantia polymorpha subsp. ruderalis]|uniref:Uncharacterized protein n=2 Tax=Marchantia polymorpha TaxID=3197 RepID=A0AAF6BIM9_MARPO|nr:hypothetical protein MARPO_0071s0070 [Marchantia polymorpha]BBN11863.1 hypothetical protein Mp_5g15390 [Marchantia polymorpha subsp. ruderalis]|eukprot:PTQ35457.1 hypothetical protein MARPO_0071s0070 [Marchantia polymorpha]